jgi:dTDP-4-amino-4,6-dideoxygalactose transaminase
MNNHYFLELFEKRLSEYTGAPYVVLTDSCSNAIFLVLKYLNLKTHLIIPENTYISVPMSILHAGYTVETARRVWHGEYELGNSNVIDAAVGFHKGMYKSGYVCLSFQAKKQISIGRGGAILLDNFEEYKIIKRLSWDGRDSSKIVDDDDGIILGYHMNMTPNQAATGVILLNNYKDNKLKYSGTWKDYSSIAYNVRNFK